jgi:RsiW-degrading membrane proteinase PrsW (M82 family)
MLNLLFALVPVVLFLAQLQVMDSFKLVRPASVFLAIGSGALAAVLCIPLHEWMIDETGLSIARFSRYVAPVTEETLKAAFLVILIARRRVGFLVDAAVQGFAVGTGFALLENLLYLQALPEAPLLLWLVRGLGTAVLHGATMAMFAMISRTLADRHPERLWLVFWPGWLLAVGIHSAFNHVPLSPVAMTLLLLIVLPALVLIVYQRSEGATREWVGAGLDLDVELLQLVRSEAFAFTRFGIYLRQLRQRFPGPVVADMFCLLRLELELSVQAKAMLLAREAGVQVPVDDDLAACLAEIEYLNASIGKTGVLALKPLMVSSHRDRWHRYLLAQAGSQAVLTSAARGKRLRAAAEKKDVAG